MYDLINTILILNIRLKDQRDRAEKEHLEESDMLRKTQYEMTSKIQALQRELEHTQV